VNFAKLAVGTCFLNQNVSSKILRRRKVDASNLVSIIEPICFVIKEQGFSITHILKKKWHAAAIFYNLY
jgi:hypothetical protein